MAHRPSSAVIAVVGLACKAFINSGLCSITVNNLPVLLNALRRDSGQGLITVSNHLSTLDDPIAWGILPFQNFTSSHTIRWVLGASDIMFTNPLFSTFFRNGQVIEVFRGSGIWQPALDLAIEKLNQGHWLHLFGEGKVHQPIAYPQTRGIANLPRFKWGVGRIIMETDDPPLIIPMWLTGFDKLMPEHRSFPYKYFPKIGIQLSVTFGDPIPPDKIIAALDTLPRSKCSPPVDILRAVPGPSDARYRGWIKDTIVRMGTNLIVDCEGPEQRMLTDEIRSEITAVVQRAVEDLGREVSGDKLDIYLPR